MLEGFLTTDGPQEVATGECRTPVLPSASPVKLPVKKNKMQAMEEEMLLLNLQCVKNHYLLANLLVAS